MLVDVRIRHARKNKDLRKANRVDYLQRTIANARRSASERAADVRPQQEYTEQNNPFQDAPEETPTLQQEQVLPPIPQTPCTQLEAPEEASSSDVPAWHPDHISAEPKPSPKAEAPALPPLPPVDDDAWSNIPAIPEAKKEAWAAIGASMGLRFLRAVCYTNAEPKELRFVVHPLVGGPVACVVMTSETLLSRGKVKSVFFDATGRVPTCLGGDAPLKPYQWEVQAQEIMAACPLDKMPEEATEEGLLRIFLRQYVSQNLDASHRASADLEEAAASGRPFLASGSIHVNVTAFAQFLRTHGVTEWGSATKVAKGFLKLKMRKRVTVYVTRDGKRKSITGYTIPSSMELELASELPAAEAPAGQDAATMQ